jgi:AraC-like DNA-binding protein
MTSARMPLMKDALSDQRTSRFLTNQHELADRIAHAIPEDGRFELQPGLFLYRASQQNLPMHAVADPSFCVIAQGSKVILLGDEQFRYDPAHYLITTLQLPMVGEVVQASPEQPYLSFRLVLDPNMVTSVMVESGLVEPREDANLKAVDVSPLGDELLDAVLRMVRLTEKPNEYRVLAPLVTREVVYRLLVGAQSGRMRHMAKLGGQTHRMAEAINTIRSNFDKPLRVEDIAKSLHMSVSGFHAHFKSVTAMSPMQFQKQLRLQEARRLMVSENFDAAQAGFQVGYDDASHFNREYKRHFGKPPKQDVEHVLNATVAKAK